MVKITATEERLGCTVTSEGGCEGASFFEAAINVFKSMNSTFDSESIAVNFLLALVDYAVEEEADWAGGCEDRCHMQVRLLRGAIAALESFNPHRFKPYRVLDRAIQKAKAFIEASKDPSDPQTP